MDPISASSFNLHTEENARGMINDDIPEEKFSEIIVSVRSLSHYDNRTFKSLRPQILAAVIAASYHMVVGISLAYSAILIPQLNETDSGIEMSKTESSWIASSISLVAPAAGLTGGFLMDRFGRLNTLKITLIPSLAGWIIMALSQNVPMIIAGRVLTGIAASWGTSPAIVYITEIARPDMRGSLISAGPALVSLGMVLAFLKGWVLSWRTVAWLCAVYSIIPIVLIQLIVPESPSWLVSKGRIDEAAKSLTWFHKYQIRPDNRNDTMAEAQLAFLQKEHQIKLEEASRKGDGVMVKVKQFFKPTGYKPLLILFGLFFFQQFSGIYITLFYSITFFQEVGSTLNPYLASTLIGVVRFVMSCVNTYMLRTFNRRPLIMVSGVGMAICMFISGLYSKWIHEGVSSQTWVPTVMILFYVITSMVGLLSIPWTMTAEMFPIEIRGVAHSIAYSVANFLMFAAVQLFWTFNEVFGGISGTQWFFAVMSLLASMYTFVLLPETHGKKLSEITDYFNYNFFVHCGGRKNKEPKKKNNVISRLPKKDIVKSSKQQSEKLLIQNEV